VRAKSIHTFHYVEGDARYAHKSPDRSFDLVSSNSVIEHVGPPENQAEFVYWVQTPSAWFPIGAHIGLPFYWHYPEWFRSWVLRRSQKKLPPGARILRNNPNPLA